MGDLGDLRRLARWSATDLGAGILLINPLHAAAPVLPQQPSPYFPSSRRFQNVLYLRVEEVPVRMLHRRHGRSSIAGLRSGYYMLRVVLALLGQRL